MRGIIFKRRKNLKCKNVLIVLLIFIMTIVCIVTSNMILKDFREYKDSNGAINELIEETIEMDKVTEEKNIDWTYLKEINKDIVAWIEITDTNISYPILQDNGIYYLKHSFNKEYNSNGAIFTNNMLPFRDNETIIHGHNMKNGIMFSELKKFLDEEFFDSHSTFKIYTPTGNYNAVIFSIYSINVNIEEYNIKSLDFEERVEYYKNMSRYNTSQYENISKIVKLATCSYENQRESPTEQRYYIIANLVPI